MKYLLILNSKIFHQQVDWIKVSEVHPNPVSFPNCSVALCASALPLDEATQSSKSDDGDAKEAVGPNVSRNFIDGAASTSQASCKGTQ